MNRTCFIGFALLLTFFPPSFASLADDLLSHNERDRVNAQQSLRQMDPASRQALLPSLVEGLAATDQVVGSWAGQALCIIGADSVPAIVRFMKENQNRGNFASTALSNMGQISIPGVRDLLKDSDSNMKLEAMRILQRMNTSARSWAWPETAALLTDSDVNVRETAAVTLGHMGYGAAGAIPKLTDALKDDAQIVRNESAAALGQLGPSADSAVEALMAGLTDTTHPIDDEFVRGALRSLNTQKAWAALNTLGQQQPSNEKYESRHSGPSQFESRRQQRIITTH